MPPGHKSTKPRPSEIAADTKRNFIPLIRSKYAEIFPPYSDLCSQPISQLAIHRHRTNTRPPAFRIENGDPAMRAIYYSMADTEANTDPECPRIRVPLICTANERRPGGDWETGSHTYEERLCRRSNLAATLATPPPSRHTSSSNYPIPSTGGILSKSVVVYRGADESYKKLDQWFDMPVVSVPPTRWPKLRNNGTKYSFAEERELIRDKMRGALRICLANGYDRVVIGDFGLGNAYRNPPQELAEMWRDIFLFDPDLRGQFRYVVFVFEDTAQNTSQLILDESLKKDKKSRSGGGKSPSASTSPSVSPTGSTSQITCLSDSAIFTRVFDDTEVQRTLSEPDPRYGLHMLTT